MRAFYETLGALRLHRHEQFAQAVAAGFSATRAYARAYARESDRATRAAAARLLANVNVARRIAELREAAAKDAEACLSTLVPMLEVRARAHLAANQVGPA